MGTDVRPHARTAWLYSRLDETVHVEVLDEAGRPHLIISGPSTERRGHDFPDEAALTRFLDDLEFELTGRGFRLIARSERRSGNERRSVARDGRDRRQP